MTRSRSRALAPWIVVAALILFFVLGRGHDAGESGGAPQLAGAPGARVQRVVDGDTVRLVGLGSVRLIGINTPEVYGHVQCFGPEASAFAKSVLRRGLAVHYRVGTEPRDRYGRLLAYLWLPDGRLFNEMLAARGYAEPLTIPPNDQLAPRFAAAAERARGAHAGMWARPGCAP